MKCMNTLTGTVTVQWWVGQGCTTPPASWTMRCWVSVSVRDGSSLPSTCLHSSTTFMGQYSCKTDRFYHLPLWVSCLDNENKRLLQKDKLVINIKNSVSEWLCHWSQELKAETGKCPIFHVSTTVLLMLSHAGTSFQTALSTSRMFNFVTLQGFLLFTGEIYNLCGFNINFAISKSWFMRVASGTHST